MADANDITKLLDKIKKESPAAAAALESEFTQLNEKIAQSKTVITDFYKAISEGSAQAISEQAALSKALKSTYGDLIDKDNQASEASKVRLGTLERILLTIQNTAKVDEDLITATQQQVALATAKKAQTTLKKGSGAGVEAFGGGGGLTGILSSLAPMMLGAAAKPSGGGIGGVIEGAIGKVTGLAGSLTDALSGLGKRAKGIVQGISKGINKLISGAAAAAAAATTSILPSIMSFVKKTYLELSTLTTGFASLTGQIMNYDGAVRKGSKVTATFASSIILLQRRNQALGATIKSITDVYTKFFTQSRTFAKLLGTNTARSRAAADALAEMSFRFTKAGLSTETYGKAVDVLGKTYRRSDIVYQSQKLGLELINIARVSDQLPDKVGKDFGDAMNQLAAYSLPQAIKIFKRLSITAAETGIEVATLLKTMGQFDTMETAAEMTGKLNALLEGPYLNTLDLVNASESERHVMLQRAFKQSGTNFNEMGKYMKLSIAGVLGTNVQEAQRMFMGDQRDIEGKIKATKTLGISYGQLTAGAERNATSINDQMTAAGQSAVLLEGAFDKVDKSMRKALKAFRLAGEAFRTMVGNVVIGALDTIDTKIEGILNRARSGDWTGFVGDVSKILLLLKVVGPGRLATMIGAGAAITGGATATTPAPAAPGVVQPGVNPGKTMQQLQSTSAAGIDPDTMSTAIAQAIVYAFTANPDIFKTVLNIDGIKFAEATAKHSPVNSIAPARLGG